MIIKKNIKKTEVEEVSQPQAAEETVKEGENYKIDLFDLDNIDFKQRYERRRGDRRRGFRRIDDRNLISRAREEAATIREAAAKEGYDNGIAQAREKFRAHVTVARRVQAAYPIRVRIPRESMEVTAFSLMKSERINGKIKYTEIACWEAGKKK